MIKNIQIIILIIWGCTPRPEPLPNWILHTKNDSLNWRSVGVGLTRDIAIKQAMNAIASQISIQIESHIKSIKAEQNFEIEEFSRSIIESRVYISLPEVQIDEVIKIENTWYARAKLNKNSYYRTLEEKRKNATTSALQLLGSVENSTKLKALQTIFKAYQEIENFLDYPLSFKSNGNINKNLYSEIITKFKDCIEAIKIKPERELYKFKSILPNRKKIPIKVTTSDIQSSDGLPFIVKFKSGKTNSKMYSNNNLMELLIEEIDPNEPSDIISIELDIESILNTKVIPNSFKIQNLAKITVQILPLKFYIHSKEFNLNKKLVDKKIYPIVSQYIKDNYSGIISNKKEKSDLIINLNLNTYEVNNKDNQWGIYKSIADFTMQVIIEDTYQELFYFSTDQVQGGDFSSFENAGSQAINNLAKQLKSEILPLLNNSLIKN